MTTVPGRLGAKGRIKNADTKYDEYWNKEEYIKDSMYYSARYGKMRDFLYFQRKKVLDVGGGTGQFLEFLGIKKAIVLDVSDFGLKQAAGHGFRTVKCDMRERMPFKSNQFDVIYCFESLEHIEDPARVMKEMNRILRPDGVLFLGIPNCPPDGIYDLSRWNIERSLNVIRDSGFLIISIRFVPIFSQIDKKIFGHWKNPKKLSVHLISVIGHYIPYSMRSYMASKIPDRFAMMFVFKLGK